MIHEIESVMMFNEVCIFAEPVEIYLKKRRMLG
jgi:hypothetical protein